MKKQLIPYFQLHFAVLLYGLTAILGDLIQIPSASLVWWRVLIASISLLFFIGFGKALFKLSRIRILQLLGIGVIVALHWVAFYGSIKYSHASIALVCMSTSSLFTALIEPTIFRVKPNFLEIFFGLLVIPGMFLVVQDLESNLIIGVWLGIFASFTASLFSVFNKKLIDEVEAFSMTFLEMVGVLLSLTLIYPLVDRKYFTPFLPSGMDWVYLLILSLLCTTLAFYLGVIVLKKLSAFESNLIINLEPVYGIFLAVVILKEHKDLGPQFYLGVLVIMLAVFLYPFVKKRKRFK